MATVNAAISDLFFNQQHGNFGAIPLDKNSDTNYFDDEHRAALKKDAETFLEMVKPVSAVELPTADELVEDFYNRI